LSKQLDKRQLLIAIPVLNEAESLPHVLKQLKQSFPQAGILVVNDGSIDETAKIAINYEVNLVSHPFNLGVGAAMRTAFRFARFNNFSYVIQFDGDGQHSPEFVENLLQELHHFDVVVGSRFSGTDNYPIQKTRKFAIKFLSLLLRITNNTIVSDPTSGNRAANRRAIELFSDDYPTEYLGDTIGSLIIAAQNDLTINEIPVRMNERQGGHASQTYSSSILHFIRIVLVCLSMSVFGGPQARKKP
jgi:glycosyltransferase involved in cell wall biosynthesis